MDMTTSIVDSVEGNVVSAKEPAGDAGQALADAADLRQKAKTQVFSAAWSDEWNPNPLSDVSL